jgi:hypothetical protein
MMVGGMILQNLTFICPGMDVIRPWHRCHSALARMSFGPEMDVDELNRHPVLLVSECVFWGWKRACSLQKEGLGFSQLHMDYKLP